jgi:hypothetical protein
MKSDDFSVSAEQRHEIRLQADRLLKKAGAYGIYPTPVKAIIAASGLKAKYVQDLCPADCEAPEKVKRALSKLQGFLHRQEGMIFVDKALTGTRRKFISIHEVAHHWLPEHHATYQILEDSETELAEETRDEFERAANCFSSDVLFQLDGFTTKALDCEFGIGAPVKQLSKLFGTGIYSTIRRYTEVCGKRAAVLICDKGPEESLLVRRFIASRQFQDAFGVLAWPQAYSADSWFGRNRPRNTFSLPTTWIMKTAMGGRFSFLVESYDSTRQVFFFIYPPSEVGQDIF